MKSILILFASLCVLCSQTIATEAKPNILLLIVADDLGYGDVNVQGCRDFATPHLDALANGGMRFAAGYGTAPVCRPSRAAMMTGRHNCWILPYEGNPPPGSKIGLPAELSSETTDRTAARPILARQLEAAWKRWDADNLAVARPPGAKRAS